MTMPTMTTEPDEILDVLELDNFFNENHLRFDLREGVVWNPAKTRVCVLSTDLLAGIFKGLLDEAGPAWKVIFKNCGRIWGQRVGQRLDRECQLLLGKRVGELPLDRYIKFTCDYFVFHGWGKLEIDLAKTREAGLVEARLENSVFRDIASEGETMVDPMIVGILAAMFSYISGQELDGVQTACPTRGDEASRFLITATTRLAEAESMIEAGTTHESLAESI